MTTLPALPKALSTALEKKGYSTLTKVQEAVISPAYAGADMLVSAQTGSGKTVGFGLAIAPTLLGQDDAFGPAESPLAIIIAPTRELALQVKRELVWLYEGAGAWVASCVGGMDMRDERRALEKGAHIVVGTPGRLKDHIERGSLDLSLVRAAVLDEADEMLDLGFREDLEFILGAAPADRRTLMFSATVPKAIEKLAQDFQRDAVRLSVVNEGSQHADITYQGIQVTPHDADHAIMNLLRFHEAQNAIIFCNTRAAVNRLTTRLSNRAFQVVALSGELSQTERSHALQAMRDGRARVCVATDVAARGIDLPNLELVIHAELPSNAETLLHRSGRTGRAGKKGISTLVATRSGRSKAERLLAQAKVKAEWVNAPSADAVRARDEERLLKSTVWGEEITERESDVGARLLAEHGAQKIAAAYVKLYMSNRSAPEELSTEAGPRDPASFGPGRWFALSVGRRDRAEARWLLPMICRSANLGKNDVGAIRIQESETFVEILETSAKGFVKALGKAMKLEGEITVRELDAPPFGATSARAPAPADRPAAPKPHRKGPRPPSAPEKMTVSEDFGLLPEGFDDNSPKKKPKWAKPKFAPKTGPKAGKFASADKPKGFAKSKPADGKGKGKKPRQG